jgi:hypothetical protein
MGIDASAVEMFKILFAHLLLGLVCNVLKSLLHVISALLEIWAELSISDIELTAFELNICLGF